MEKIYLDYAATTPVDPKVRIAMAPYFSEKLGNPSSLHSFGQEAMAAVDRSRETIARILGADFREIIFTGSATEANNLALRGAVKQFKISNFKFKIPRIIVSAIEHESILETAKDLEKNENVEVVYLTVNKNGVVDLKKFKDFLNERTILVSVMHANNEIGVIQPISEIARIISAFREDENKKLNRNIDCVYPIFHSDTAQSFQFLSCNVLELGVDMMTISAHKLYGPKGVGVLFHKNIAGHSYLSPIICGGGQEFDLRSGTENVAGIVGFAKAVELSENFRDRELKRILELKNYFWNGLKKIYPKAEINGIKNRESRIKRNDFKKSKSIIYDSLFSIPNIINVYFPNRKAEDLIIKMDIAGLAVSAGSACTARATKFSHVLTALGLSKERIRGSVRFSFGRFTTESEVKEALIRLKSSILFDFAAIDKLN